MTRIIGSIILLFVLGCASSQTASYRYTQKQIERGDLDFESRLRVNEYVNAFPQDELAKPKAGEDLALQIDYFTDSLPKGNNTTLAQIAVRTRDANAAEKVRKLGISLVLDVSGSMGFENKFRDAVEATLAMVSELSEGTEFALIKFSDEASVVIEPTVVTQQTRETIKEKIKKIDYGGGTNIEAGLVLGYKAMSQFSKASQSRLLLLTDGQSNVGVTDPKELAKKAGVQYMEGARISTVGLGHDVDEHLLRGIAEQGHGAYYFAENGSALKALFLKDVQSLMIPIAKDVKVVIKGGAQTVLKQVYGYDQPLAKNSFSAELGELNSDDWRIFIVEVEGKDKPVTLEASAAYRTIFGKTTITKKTSKTIALGGQKPQLNRVVARNAVVFSNAITLIEVSKLDKAQKYKEAEDIVTIQLANLEVARSLDKTPALSKEAENLMKVRKVLQEKQGQKGQDLMQPAPATPEPSILKPLVKSALNLAEKSIPGPWSLVISLISLVIE